MNNKDGERELIREEEKPGSRFPLGEEQLGNQKEDNGIETAKGKISKDVMAPDDGGQWIVKKLPLKRCKIKNHRQRLVCGCAFAFALCPKVLTTWYCINVSGFIPFMDQNSKCLR